MTKYFKNEFAVNGDKVDIPNDMQASGEVSYQTGFGIDYQRKLGTDLLAKPFPRQGFNGLMADLTGAIQQYQQNGFFDFITPEMNGGEAFPYAMGATVRYDLSEAKDGSDIRNFISLINHNKGNPKDDLEDWIELGSSKTGGYGFPVITITTSVFLTEDQAGIILIDASAGDVTVTLPNTENSIGFILRRIDNTVYKVRVQVIGTDKIKYNTAINANGYTFFNLFGAGDYWRVVSDGLGNWFDIERKDNNPIGGTTFLTSTIIPAGGYVVPNGALLSRTEYPYLWDYAQKSGALDIESEITGNEGCFTSGDGATTFGLPNLQGYFLRALNTGSGIDAGRAIGTCQEDAIRNITGSISSIGSFAIPFSDTNVKGAFGYQYTGRGNSTDGSWAQNFNALLFDASKVVPIASENRPINIAYPIYIKII